MSRFFNIRGWGGGTVIKRFIAFADSHSHVVEVSEDMYAGKTFRHIKGGGGHGDMTWLRAGIILAEH